MVFMFAFFPNIDVYHLQNRYIANVKWEMFLREETSSVGIALTGAPQNLQIAMN